MSDYHALLSSVLCDQPELSRYLAACRHCGIFFLTDPRNAGRQDLGCPFGCAEAHRKRESTRRSVAYYRQPEGKEKKRRLNQRRHRIDPAGTVNGKNAAPSASRSRNSWNRPLLEYVRLAASLIEGRRVSLKQAENLLAQIVRQHSMARLREIDHLVAKLHQNPP